MLTTQDISIVKSTVPLLIEGGVAVTEHFYHRLFKYHPELKDIFNVSHQNTGQQQEALFAAILAYAKNIDNLAVLRQAVERIAHKHTSILIQPEHYSYVGVQLIETLRDLLPEQFTSEVEQAWSNAYRVLANIFIEREQALYDSKANQQGGWRGKRVFSVVTKQQESALVTSFTFEPVDCLPVLAYQAGQYISLQLPDKQCEHTEIRHYSLSNKPNGSSYRISVKRALGTYPGLVSNYLHDKLSVGDLVDLYPPAGDFYFVDRQAPVILVSAGVGVTPMQAMLEHLAEVNYPYDVHYLHACENSEQHSFAKRTAELCQQHGWQQVTWYNSDKATVNQANIKHGLLDFNAMVLPFEHGEFYLCGPLGFMQAAHKQLVALGVDKTRIRYEMFGPHTHL